MFDFWIENSKYRLFEDSFVFSKLGILIDLILIIHFVISWRKDYLKTGWLIDYWYTTIFMTFFLNLLIAYPFMGSSLNDLAIGSSNEIVYDYIDLAFYISILGYIFTWIGRFIFDISNKHNPLLILTALSKPFEKIIEGNIKSNYTIWSIFLIFILLNSIIIIFQITSGNIFNVRAFFLFNPQIRPIFNIVVSIYPISSAFIVARIIQDNLLIHKVMLLVSIILSSTLGSRSILLSVFINMITFYAYKNYKKINLTSLIKIIGVGLIIILLALYLSDVRELQFDPLITFGNIGLNLFYGNNFSDTRDFAWILSKWNSDYLYGVTYLAALLSFIPSSFLPFRQDWSISRYTNELVGFDSSIHAGLRPGSFGEVFLNFGFFGPIILGFITGFILRYADKSLKNAITRNNDIVKGYSKTFIFIVLSNFYITAGFWTLYVFIIINVFLYYINSVFFKIKKRPFVKSS